MIFEPITLAWQGEEKTVAADRVMMMLAKMEDVLTLMELERFRQRGGVPMTKLAMCYGVALRYAGFPASDEQVYSSMFDDGDAGLSANAAVSALYGMMIPPEHLRRGGEAEDGESSLGKIKPATSS